MSNHRAARRRASREEQHRERHQLPCGCRSIREEVREMRGLRCPCGELAAEYVVWMSARERVIEVMAVCDDDAEASILRAESIAHLHNVLVIPYDDVQRFLIEFHDQDEGMCQVAPRRLHGA